jgi:carbamate kinase
MGPKIEAAVHFVEEGGGRAAIGDLSQARETLRGEAGTVVVERTREESPA